MQLINATQIQKIHNLLTNHARYFIRHREWDIKYHICYEGWFGDKTEGPHTELDTIYVEKIFAFSSWFH